MQRSIYLGTRKGLFRLAPAGNRWQIERVWFAGDHISMLHVDPRDGAIYAAMMHGHFGVKMQRSRDHGETWEETLAPAFPPKPDDLDDRDGWGRPLEWKTKQVWALEAGDPNQPGELWCGTIPGGLFHSVDSGDSWQLVESLWYLPERKQWMGGGADWPGIHSICVDPKNSRRVFVAVSCGGAYLSEDGGATWQIRSQGMRAEFLPPEQQYNPVSQDPHIVVQCRSQIEKMWCQHHNGIFRSVDEGVSWQEIEKAGPSVFGFAVAVHPNDGDRAWFIPGVKDEKRYPVDAKLVVTRTYDGGKTFETLRNGLPQAHAYDIVYRHAFVIDPAGEALAFGSTTGNCYTSVDAGDSWQCVGQNLPPIYCVKFA